MRRLITILAASFVCLFANGQDLKQSLLDEFKGVRTTLSYEYVITGVQDITVEGKAVVQNECFRIEGAGLLILCDSQNVWTLDMEGKEAYVESAGPMNYTDYLLALERNEDGSLEGSAAEPNSDTIINFRLFDMVKTPASGDLSDFVPPASVFNDGSDWIITDLR